MHFGSQMIANFYEAILSFIAALSICMLFAKRRGQLPKTGNTIFDRAMSKALRPSPALVMLSIALLALCLLLNLLWW